MNKTSQPIRSVSFKTLGCKLNQSESDAIEAKFRDKGFAVQPYGDAVDLTVINTCTVTNDADSGSRAAIRHAIRTSPGGRIAVTGCYAQVSPDEIKAISGVDLVLGSDEKYRIFDYLDSLKDGKLEEPLVYVNDEGEFDSVSEDGFVSATSRARAFLKVQEGCDYFCSYCIIPFSRGRARSRPYADAIAEAKKLADQGYKEIVLTGINIGTYTYENGKTYGITDLLDGLQNVEGLERIRLSSIEPNTVTDDLLKLIRDSNVLCPHMHIPVQGGNDDQLAAMNRKYSIGEYAALMERFRKFLPDAALGTDIITGFPGETDAHFENTVRFIQTSPFTYLHVFRYSPRKGTAAVKLTGHVDPQTVKRRAVILHETNKMLKTAYARRFLGATLPVLFDHEKDGVQTGYTPNYLSVAVSHGESLRKRILRVRLTDVRDGGNVTGELILPPDRPV
jgi:threonylcarbamoyladenosine tRNA methylthiotransferase MtaB